MSVHSILAQILRDEGDLHTWRCEYPHLYGPCTCLDDTARMMVEALHDAGHTT